MRLIEFTIVLLCVSGCSALRNRVVDPNIPTSETVAKESGHQDLQESALEPQETESPDGEIAEPDEAVAEYHPEDLEEGFCRDDVNSTYLRSQYAAEMRKNRPKFHSARSASLWEQNLEFESIFHARRHLEGEMRPYFGALPVVSNPRVEFWMRHFEKSARSTFLKWLVRAESMRGAVQTLIKQEGIPPELFFLGLVESGFSTTAYSRARATGAWQFMKGTAHLYGLKINHWVDERRDLTKSTLAAARYLKDLYVQFGDWYLAMAAYNAGPGKIQRAIRKTGSRDFWKIARTTNIKAETKDYVPKVLAALIIASDPTRHGFEVSPEPSEIPPSEFVRISDPVSINEVAKELDINPYVLRSWNPELINDVTPPARFCPKEGYALKLGPGYSERFESIRERLSFIEIKDVLMHKVRPGDSLYGIARRYKVTLQQIQSLNPRLSPRALRVGSELAIPVPGIVVVKQKVGSV